MVLLKSKISVGKTAEYNLNGSDQSRHIGRAGAAAHLRSCRDRSEVNTNERGQQSEYEKKKKELEKVDRAPQK